MTTPDGIDWARVADAIRKRMDDLVLNQSRLEKQAKVSPITLRDLVHNRSDSYRHETLVKVSMALGWGSDGLVRIGRGEDPDRVEAEIAAANQDYDLVEMVLAVQEKLDQVIRRLDERDDDASGSGG